MSNDKYLYRTPPKVLNEFKDPKLREEVEFLREKEKEADEDRIRKAEEKRKEEKRKRPINEEQRKKYKEDTKNFLFGVLMILVGPFFLVLVACLFLTIPGSTTIALLLCLLAIVSMVWAIHNKIPIK